MFWNNYRWIETLVEKKKQRRNSDSWVCLLINPPPNPPIPPGLPHLLQQRGSRGPEWDRGMQVPVCLGPLELPWESPAVVHAQQPTQRYVPTPTSPPSPNRPSSRWSNPRTDVLLRPWIVEGVDDFRQMYMDINGKVVWWITRVF